MKLNEAIALIRAVPDFPFPGILFQDIAPVLADPIAFQLVTKQLNAVETEIDFVVGIESRGFILASAVANSAGLGFVPIRKAGKLPAPVIARSYGLEYGNDCLEISTTAFGAKKLASILLIDDVLATGGTLIAALELVAELGATVTQISVLLEIAALGGRAKILSAFPELKIMALATI